MIDDMRMTNDGRGVRDVVRAMRAVGCATAERGGASSDARGGRAPQFPMISNQFQSLFLNYEEPTSK